MKPSTGGRVPRFRPCPEPAAAAVAFAACHAAPRRSRRRSQRPARILDSTPPCVLRSPRQPHGPPPRSSVQLPTGHAPSKSQPPPPPPPLTPSPKPLRLRLPNARYRLLQPHFPPPRLRSSPPPRCTCPVRRRRLATLRWCPCLQHTSGIPHRAGSF